MKFCIQNISSSETNAIRQFCITQKVDYITASSREDAIAKGVGIGWLPVGTVEFCRDIFWVCGIWEDLDPMPYPSSLRYYLKRTVRCLDKDEVKSGFVKPVFLKEFDGFVLGTKSCSEYDSYSGLVWNSDVVDFIAEWRYYIIDNAIAGVGRYDADDNEEHKPNHLVERMIKDVNISHPYALDVGLCSDGEYRLVEYTDAWAIGLYERALNPAQYARFLWERFYSN